MLTGQPDDVGILWMHDKKKNNFWAVKDVSYDAVEDDNNAMDVIIDLDVDIKWIILISLVSSV
jgi:hypothetical protein